MLGAILLAGLLLSLGADVVLPTREGHPTAMELPCRDSSSVLMSAAIRWHRHVW